jgi:hypothetical protein
MSRSSKTGLIVLGACLVCTVCSALIVEMSSGIWPKSWPKELEPFRARARTFEVANGIQENIYEITFTNREDFEKLWPVLLSIKSKNGLITLEQSPLTNFVAGSTMHAGVCIIAPPGRPSALPSGAAAGDLPEYVNHGFQERARIDLLVVSDGQLIDPARISIPAGTTVIDHRAKR